MPRSARRRARSPARAPAPAACSPARTRAPGSKGEHAEQRALLRDSWFQLPAVRAGLVTPRFFLAEPARAEARRAVAAELAAHGDVELLRGQPEAYGAVPHQTLAMLRYFSSNSSVLWIIKTDDDVFLRADVARRALLQTAWLFPPGARLYTGWMVMCVCARSPRAPAAARWRCHRVLIALVSASRARSRVCPRAPMCSARAWRRQVKGAQPHRNGKWAVSKEEYPDSHYPEYASGPTYALTTPLARRILKLHNASTSRAASPPPGAPRDTALPWLHLEDVAMGLWVRAVEAGVRVHRRDDRRFYKGRFCVGCVVAARLWRARLCARLCVRFMCLGARNCHCAHAHTHAHTHKMHAHTRTRAHVHLHARTLAHTRARARARKQVVGLGVAGARSPALL